MPELFQIIQGLVANGQYVIGQHASDRMEERGIIEWQVVDGFSDCVLLLERQQDKPFPSIEVEELLPEARKLRLSGRICPTAA